MKIEAAAYGKINLGLHVTGVKPNGFHNIESLVTFINLKDIIEVRTSSDLKLSIDGPFAHTIPQDSNNIVIQAAKFLAVEKKAHIKITKNLPVEAGLGGGSADAAATLSSLSKLWKIPIPKNVEILGADVPICLKCEPAIIKGIGEKITPIIIPKNLPMILIKPKIGLSTKKIFKNLTNKKNQKMPDFLGTESLESFYNYLNFLRNDLASTAIFYAPVIKEIINFLKVQGGIKYVQMSGSGTTCFGLFDTSENAKISLKKAKSHFPDMWCEITELINPRDNITSK